MVVHMHDPTVSDPLSPKRLSNFQKHQEAQDEATNRFTVGNFGQPNILVHTNMSDLAKFESDDTF